MGPYRLSCWSKAWSPGSITLNYITFSEEIRCANSDLPQLLAGLLVIVMSAIDYDDPEEGGNAQLTYNIEKNVLDEHSGTAIFSIEPHTGEIHTAVCCLDREKTSEYTLQVVAMDGGGLKGICLYHIFLDIRKDLLGCHLVNKINTFKHNLKLS